MGASPEGAAEKQAKIVGIRTPAVSLAVAMGILFCLALQKCFNWKS